jgi:SAM-dependent methyltransferase
VADSADVISTRTAYNDIAEIYTEFVRNHLDSQPFDRAMLGVFAELVQTNGSGRVADLGCGPGRLTAHLTGLGLDVFGLDLSSRMIELARTQYPELSFDVGSLEHLDIADGTLAGVLAWYSIIHLPPERVQVVLREFHRVLEAGGYALLGFQATDAQDVEPFDHKVIRAYRWPPQRLAELAAAAGFTAVARLVREPDSDERFLQAYLLLTKDR